MQARFYAPMYHRFLSPDPARDQHFELTQSWNIYSYVQNQPTMKIDPTGLFWEELKNKVQYGHWETNKQGDARRAAAHPVDTSLSRAYDASMGGGRQQSTAAAKQTPGHSESATTPGRKTWVSPTPDGGSAKGKLVDDGHGNYKGQCVSLAKNQTGIPSTGTWHQGEAVQGNTSVQPGTVIAAMKNGKDWSGGGHVGLYVGQDAKGGLRMTDQFVTGGDHPVATRTYAWEGHGDHPSVQSQGSKYHVVETGK